VTSETLFEEEKKLLTFSKSINHKLRKDLSSRALRKQVGNVPVICKISLGIANLFILLASITALGASISFYEWHHNVLARNAGATNTKKNLPRDESLIDRFISEAQTPVRLQGKKRTDYTARFAAQGVIYSAIGFAVWFLMTRLSYFIYWRSVRFVLMRFEDFQIDLDYPYIFTLSQDPDTATGFNRVFFKDVRIKHKGEIVVAVKIKEIYAAVIYLRKKGRLPITSWTLNTYKEMGLRPCKPCTLELAVAFSHHASNYHKIIAPLEASTRLHSETLPTEAIDPNIIKALWKRLHLSEETKNNLITQATHFSEGQPYASQGLLLYGPPGTGKTLIAKTLSETIRCKFVSLSVADLKSDRVGGSSTKTAEVWDKALAAERAVLFIDECDAIFSERGGVGGDKFVDDIVSTFLAKWDGLDKQKTVWVVGATNRPHALDEAIKSRFSERIEIPLPAAEHRIEILKQELAENRLEIKLPHNIDEITKGFSGRNLSVYAKNIARLDPVSRSTSLAFWEEEARRIRTSLSTQTDTKAKWANLILPDSTLKKLKVTAEALQSAEVLEKKGFAVPRGILLYGPPGTGKTQIARTMANEIGLSFIGANISDLKANYLGQSANKVRSVFERARNSSPSILFIDEIDIVARDRNSSQHDSLVQEMIGQLLQELDGVKAHAERVFLLAATNHREKVDGAILSRFPTQIEVPLPDLAARERIVKVMLKGKPLSIDLDLICGKVAQATTGRSGRDLRSLVEEAEQSALSRAIESKAVETISLSLDDFLVNLDQ